MCIRSLLVSTLLESALALELITVNLSKLSYYIRSVTIYKVLGVN